MKYWMIPLALIGMFFVGCQSSQEEKVAVVNDSEGPATEESSTPSTITPETLERVEPVDDSNAPVITKEGETMKSAEKEESAKTEKMEAVSEVIMPGPDDSPFLDEKSFVTQWSVLGPFQFKAADFGGESQQMANEHAFVENEAELSMDVPAPDNTSWKTIKFKGTVNSGQVDLNKVYGGIDHAAAYAVAYLDSPREINNATLYMGSDDYVKVWLNGKVVHSYNEQRRGSDWDQDMATGLTLKKGINKVVVKCVDVVGGWDFYFRLTDEEDRIFRLKME